MVLVNARDAKHVPGRKTDVSDAQWLQRLTERAASGAAPLVAASSIPGPAGPDRPPTPAMKAYVVSLAKEKGRKPPRGYANSGAICRAFLDQHAGRKGGMNDVPPAAVQRASRSDRQHASGAASPAVSDVEKVAKGRSRTPKARVRKATPPGSSAGDGAPKDVRLNIPYGNKETAQRLGARYRDGVWYEPAGLDLSQQFRNRGWI